MGLNITDICIILLLFADDMVIIGQSKEDLQSSLTRLNEYCSIWGLDVNIENTKVVIFRKKSNMRACQHFCYNEQKIEIMDNSTKHPMRSMHSLTM